MSGPVSFGYEHNTLHFEGPADTYSTALETSPTKLRPHLQIWCPTS